MWFRERYYIRLTGVVFDPYGEEVIFNNNPDFGSSSKNRKQAERNRINEKWVIHSEKLTLN